MSFYTTVRYGKMSLVARFKTDRQEYKQRDRCIVRTDRGRELGTVLTPLEEVPATVPPESLWDFVRRASAEDLLAADKIDRETRVQNIKMCKEAVKRFNLPMKVVEVDHVFGGERVIFYFVSETRVDFRELVKHLAHELRTRIELKQIGARDEARLVGDCGHCGLSLCCRGHLKELGGITMDMAKIQKHTADPSKITGRCGKLLCCLRYEYAAYTEARDLLPPRGTNIDTKKGVSGVVVDQNILLREVTIKDAKGDRVVVPLEEIVGAPQRVAGCNGCETPNGEEPSVETKTRRFLERDTQVESIEAEPPPPPPPEFLKVAKVADVPSGSRKIVQIHGKPVVLFNIDGALHAITGECPHQGGPLGEGKLEGNVVTCPWHKWTFDVVTGHGVAIPTVGVRKFEIKAEGDDILVKG